MANPQYRDFRSPPAWTRDGSRDPSNTDSWIDWMVNDERLIHDYLPRPAGTCQFCGSPVGTGASGNYFPWCFNCNQVRHVLDILVPGSYSLDNGLEGLVRHFKDFGWMWAAAPVATLLWEMLTRHGECIRRAAGPDAIYTWVPGNDEARTFDHIETLLTSVTAPDEFGWRNDVIARNRDVPRPRPGKANTLIEPAAYTVLSDVRGRTVVLLDDLWTSGASLTSAAAALKSAGASRAIGVVIGRQLRRGYDIGRSTEVFAEVEARGWAFDECVLCSRP